MGDGILLHGVDFSGADSGGLAKIRVVTRDLGDLRKPVASMGRMDRRGLLRAILASRDDGREHLWRVDAPMGIPAEIAREFGVGPGWIEVARWMQSLGSPRLWRSEVRGLTRREPRRACDVAMSTPMSPLNLRVFKQTWTFVAELLRQLAQAGVGVEPVHAASGGVTVCEGCPASVLRLKGWPDHGYKGAGDPPRRVRADILKRLQGRERLVLAAEMARAAEDDPEGDLLDAILLVTDPLQWVPPVEARVEGWVY